MGRTTQAYGVATWCYWEERTYDTTGLHFGLAFMEFSVALRYYSNGVCHVINLQPKFGFHDH
jgi:hypothetical protein